MTMTPGAIPYARAAASARRGRRRRRRFVVMLGSGGGGVPGRWWALAVVEGIA